jgi:hypothetical protein
LKADYRCRRLASPAGHESDSEYPRARAQVIVSKHGMRREAPLRKWAMLHESSPWVPKKAMSPVKQVLSANDGTPDTMRSSEAFNGASLIVENSNQVSLQGPGQFQGGVGKYLRSKKSHKVPCLWSIIVPLDPILWSTEDRMKRYFLLRKLWIVLD